MKNSIRFLLLLLVASVLILSCGKSSTDTNGLSKNIGDANDKKNSEWDKAINEFNNKKYGDAEFHFSHIKESDSMYSQAQEKMKICEQFLNEQNEEYKKENAKKDAIERKYNNILGAGYLHEKESKLMDNGFKQIKSGYEPCPDGSNQIATYFSKQEGGYTVNVRLQYSYSIEHHYCKIWVE